MLLAVTLPALWTEPAAGAKQEEERLDCLGRVRREYGTCVREAQARCREEFEERLGGCFGTPECPEACVATEEACSKEPLLERDGCRLACQADARVAQQGCRVEADREACRRTVRVKAVKCREQCNRRAGPAIGRCRDAFSDCLRACARKE